MLLYLTYFFGYINYNISNYCKIFLCVKYTYSRPNGEKSNAGARGPRGVRGYSGISRAQGSLGAIRDSESRRPTVPILMLCQ